MTKNLTRREFAQISAAAALAMHSMKAQPAAQPPEIREQGGHLQVQGAKYSWEYSKENDTFQLLDSKRGVMTSGRLQPAVVIARGDAAHSFSPGRFRQWRIEPGKVTFEYEGVNGKATATLSWRFEAEQAWLEPVSYTSPETDDVVSLRYFAEANGGAAEAVLASTYFVVPGISEGSSISPIVRDIVHMDETLWLGRGSAVPGLLQQWGLPVHFFCGFSIPEPAGGANAYSSGLSDTFLCGLAELPDGDFFIDLKQGKSSPWMDYRSDLWKHMRTPGKLTLGARLLWVFGENYYDAIGRYYAALMAAGIIHRKEDSPERTAVALTPQFCTWGTQVSQRRQGGKLDEAFLRGVYGELKASGMKAGMFSIDDKWEGTYGKLEHDAERFPHFEQFLDEVRADGRRIGIWAALMRCERPADLGLTEDHVLKQPDGKPFIASEHPKYFILDFTQPEVAKVLSEIAKKFVRRYRPDLVKFDFGYELPPVTKAGPKDKQWAGERLMWKGLDVVIRAMREEKPDIVVMYYQLSPFFIDYFDLHSPDDLFLASGEYDLEANRRFFFSSLLGRLGVPTYGSTGYDWASAPEIWFDSAAIGTLGSLNDFRADEQGDGVKVDRIARYNGLTNTLRTAATFDIVPIGVEYEAPSRGAHARSWARLEKGELVLLALRPVHVSEINPLAEKTPPKIAHAVRADVPVVVSAKGDGDLSSGSKLAVVPYANGTVSIFRSSGARARIRHHYFNGKLSESDASVKEQYLTLSIDRKDGTGTPLEWIEIQFI